MFTSSAVSFTGCAFGGRFYSLEDTWHPDLGEPFGVMHCVQCYCEPVSTSYTVCVHKQPRRAGIFKQGFSGGCEKKTCGLLIFPFCSKRDVAAKCLGKSTARTSNRTVLSPSATVPCCSQATAAGPAPKVRPLQGSGPVKAQSSAEGKPAETSAKSSEQTVRVIWLHCCEGLSPFSSQLQQLHIFPT